jgi:hypothetical protein
MQKISKKKFKGKKVGKVGVIEYLNEYFGTSRMQIRKTWLNKLENVKKNIFMNIIWHLFAG